MNTAWKIDNSKLLSTILVAANPASVKSASIKEPTLMSTNSKAVLKKLAWRQVAWSNANMFISSIPTISLSSNMVPTHVTPAKDDIGAQATLAGGR